MKILSIIIALFYMVHTGAQNIGINNPIPSHDLDVNGDINLNGQILLDETNGQAGQMIQSNGDGTMSWVTSTTNYKYVVSFRSNGTWTMPAGVTEIRFEMWGGGGRGGTGGGGGSGAYLTNTIQVTPSDNISYTIGTGGNSATSQGGSTEFQYNGITYRASGGYGAGTTNPGFGAWISSSSNVVRGFAVSGKSGNPTTKSYDRITETEYLRKTHYGYGGNSYKHSNGGSGRVDHYDSLSNSFSNYAGRNGTIPGGGGGGGSTSYSGGSGLLVIYYN